MNSTLSVPAEGALEAAASSAAPSGPVPVLYLLCKGRSGSTLTGLLLGAHSRIANLGEVEFFADRFPVPPPEKRCSCGRPLRECEYWARVMDRVEAAVGERGPELRTEDDKDFERFNEAVFRAVAAEDGGEIVLDKSKKLARARRLARSPRFDVTVLHIVRDGRAVANSFYQRGVRKDRAHYVKFNFYKNAFRWAYLNLWMALRFAGSKRYLRIRYEDLMREPEATLRTILDRVGLPFEEQILQFGTVEMHDFAGNRMRFTGVREIRPDHKYLREVTPKRWRLATLIQLPALLFFGYPLARPRVAEEPS